jgi:hypothetical protein
MQTLEIPRESVSLEPVETEQHLRVSFCGADRERQAGFPQGLVEPQ